MIAARDAEWQRRVEESGGEQFVLNLRPVNPRIRHIDRFVEGPEPPNVSWNSLSDLLLPFWISEKDRVDSSTISSSHPFFIPRASQRARDLLSQLGLLSVCEDFPKWAQPLQEESGRAAIDKAQKSFNAGMIDPLTRAAFPIVIRRLGRCVEQMLPTHVSPFQFFEIVTNALNVATEDLHVDDQSAVRKVLSPRVALFMAAALGFDNEFLCCVDTLSGLRRDTMETLKSKHQEWVKKGEGALDLNFARAHCEDLVAEALAGADRSVVGQAKRTVWGLFQRYCDSPEAFAARFRLLRAYLYGCDLMKEALMGENLGLAVGQASRRGIIHLGTELGLSSPEKAIGFAEAIERALQVHRESIYLQIYRDGRIDSRFLEDVLIHESHCESLKPDGFPARGVKCIGALPIEFWLASPYTRYLEGFYVSVLGDRFFHVPKMQAAQLLLERKEDAVQVASTRALRYVVDNCCAQVEIIGNPEDDFRAILFLAVLLEKEAQELGSELRKGYPDIEIDIKEIRALLKKVVGMRLFAGEFSIVDSSSSRDQRDAMQVFAKKLVPAAKAAMEARIDRELRRHHTEYPGYCYISGQVVVIPQLELLVDGEDSFHLSQVAALSKTVLRFGTEDSRYKVILPGNEEDPALAPARRARNEGLLPGIDILPVLLDAQKAGRDHCIFAGLHAESIPITFATVRALKGGVSAEQARTLISSMCFSDLMGARAKVVNRCGDPGPNRYVTLVDPEASLDPNTKVDSFCVSPWPSLYELVYWAKLGTMARALMSAEGSRYNKFVVHPPNTSYYLYLLDALNNGQISPEMYLEWCDVVDKRAGAQVEMYRHFCPDLVVEDPLEVINEFVREEVCRSGKVEIGDLRGRLSRDRLWGMMLDAYTEELSFQDINYNAYKAPMLRHGLAPRTIAVGLYSSIERRIHVQAQNFADACGLKASIAGLYLHEQVEVYGSEITTWPKSLYHIGMSVRDPKIWALIGRHHNDEGFADAVQRAVGIIAAA